MRKGLPEAQGYNPRAQGRSSIGRAPVSKTGGWGFESLRPCWARVIQLETATGAIASAVAGRPVSVRCESDSDWLTMSAGAGFQPAQVLGFVSFAGTQPVGYAELSPTVCRSLQSFATATTKPTKCRLTVRVTRNKRVRTTTQPPAPCFANGHRQAAGNSFWDAYFATTEALQTLVHEPIHLKGDPVEADAECYGMQYLAYAAQQLGDAPEDAAAIAQYYATLLYPPRRTQAPDYWSPECRAGGALDLTPNDGVWP